VASWEIILHPEVDAWYLTLNQKTAETVTDAIDYLAEHGPGLGRPTVDSIEGSRHHNMKELRTGTIRILFCFDPLRAAILLVAGDKRDRWRQWYKSAIPLADDRYDEWLKIVSEGGGAT
jgi:hypothetical protein